jgi:hypothetical protein
MHIVAVWKASAAMPPCALISLISCSDDTSLETCQDPTAREQAADADPAAPEQLEAPVVFHLHPIHDSPQCHKFGKWVKPRRPDRTRLRPYSLGRSGNRGNRQAMEVAPCSFGLLWCERNERDEHLAFFMMRRTVKTGKGNMQINTPRTSF